MSPEKTSIEQNYNDESPASEEAQQASEAQATAAIAQSYLGSAAVSVMSYGRRYVTCTAGLGYEKYTYVAHAPAPKPRLQA